SLRAARSDGRLTLRSPRPTPSIAPRCSEPRGAGARLRDPRRRVITVSRTHSRSSAVLRDDELRLPRPPGIIRQFWARHPRFADILIALICLLLSVGASAAPGSRTVPVTPWAAALVGVAIVATAVLLVWRRRR